MATLDLQPARAIIYDEAAIRTVVESVAVLADIGNFESLERLFADEIAVDYASLTGGEPELKSPEALMTEWAALLPGFDRTRHAISGIDVSIEGQAASASADVVADHYVGDLFWQVRGTYDYRFVRLGDDWLIAAIRFNRLSEKGSREVFDVAAARAAASPVAYLERRQTAQTVQQLLTALETKDMAAFAASWADDAVQQMPFSPQGHPKKAVGKADILALYADWPQISGRADFTSALVIYPMLDPQSVFVEFEGEVEIIRTGRIYRQTYGGLFHVDNGKIRLFREFFDPAPFLEAFGL